MESVPEALDNVIHDVMRLQIEKRALKKEKDDLSIKRLEKIESELEEKTRIEKELRDSWNKEKEVFEY